jgi:hypothetical protein
MGNQDDDLSPQSPRTFFPFAACLSLSITSKRAFSFQGSFNGADPSELFIPEKSPVSEEAGVSPL